MKRFNDFNDISDGRRYGANDLVKADCGGCKGCSECCSMVDTILLDPYDIYQMTKKLGKTCNTLLLEHIIELNVQEGIILPNLTSNKTTGKCSLLTPEGWCSIHDARPGFCRLFPLGRIYNNDDRTFSYFIQTHECPYPAKTKIKVSKWLGIPDLARYEAFISDWHKLQNKLIKLMSETDEASAQKINYGFMKLFFTTDYNTYEDFYPQFESRTKMLY